jgi:predicted dehydrogenase
MRTLRFALFGAGFWAPYQLAGWKESGPSECVAVYNRTPARAERLVSACGLDARVYSDPSELLTREDVDFVDIVTSPETHLELTALGASFRRAVVCQKPMAPSLAEAQRMVEACGQAGVPLLINENWRWQEPIRRLGSILADGGIGTPYRARIRMASAFPVFENQPALKEQQKFLIMDIGSHILDVARFLFGEAESVYCQTRRIRRDIRGEDVATVVLKTTSCATVVCEMGYAGTPLELDHFPQTFIFVEGETGSVDLAADYRIRLTRADAIETVTAAPRLYPWVDPAYAVVHASIVPCQANLLAALRGDAPAETTGEDNLKTMRLVHEAYESARRNEAIHL